MVVTSPEYTKSKYKLAQLKAIEEYVASVVQVNIPVTTLKHHIIKKKEADVAVFKFNNPITGFCAFTHKAGIHAKGKLIEQAFDFRPRIRN